MIDFDELKFSGKTSIAGNMIKNNPGLKLPPKKVYIP